MLASQVEDLGFEPRRVRLAYPRPPLNPGCNNLGRLSRTGKDDIFPVIVTLSAYKWPLLQGLGQGDPLKEVAIKKKKKKKKKSGN